MKRTVVIAVVLIAVISISLCVYYSYNPRSNSPPPPSSISKVGCYLIEATTLGYSQYTPQQIVSAYSMSQDWLGGENKIDYTSTMTTVHQLDPSYECLMYRNLKDIDQNIPEDWQPAYNNGWLLKDASGKYVASVTWPENHYVNLLSTGYQSWIVAKLSSTLASHPFLDGIFLDNSIFCNVQDWEGDSNGMVAINPSTHNPFTDQEIVSACSTLHNLIKSAIGSKLLICNGIWTGSWIQPQRKLGYDAILSKSTMDGFMNEGWLYSDWSDQNLFPQTLDFLGWVQDSFLANYPDRYFVSVFYTPNPQYMVWGYCSMLLDVKHPHNYIGFGDLLPDQNVGGFRELQEMNQLDLGDPLGNYFMIGSVYCREFAKGTVYVNPTFVTQSVTVSGTHKILLSSDPSTEGLTISLGLGLNSHFAVVLGK